MANAIAYRQFALDHPDRVRRLALIDAGFFMPSSSPLETVIHLPLGIGRAVTWHALGDGPFSYVKRICQQKRECESRNADSEQNLQF